MRQVGVMSDSCCLQGNERATSVTIAALCPGCPGGQVKIIIIIIRCNNNNNNQYCTIRIAT